MSVRETSSHKLADPHSDRAHAQCASAGVPGGLLHVDGIAAHSKLGASSQMVRLKFGTGTRPLGQHPASARISAPPSVWCSTQSSPALHVEQIPPSPLDAPPEPPAPASGPGGSQHGPFWRVPSS